MECYGQQICFQSAVDKLRIANSFFILFQIGSSGIMFYTCLFTMCFVQEYDHLPGFNVWEKCAKNVLLGLLGIKNVSRKWPKKEKEYDYTSKFTSLCYICISYNIIAFAERKSYNLNKRRNLAFVFIYCARVCKIMHIYDHLPGFNVQENKSFKE